MGESRLNSISYKLMRLWRAGKLSERT